LTGWLARRPAPLLIGLVAGLLAVALGLLAGSDAAERAGFAARAALPLFLGAFLASTLVRRWPGDMTRAFAAAPLGDLFYLVHRHRQLCGPGVRRRSRQAAGRLAGQVTGGAVIRPAKS
jgi:hypothetical protein